MKKDKAKGAAREQAGKVQRGAASMVGNEKQEAKGATKEVFGKAQKERGKAQEAAEKARGNKSRR